MADILMPKMGFDMAEGTIVRWIKQVGDVITKGEAIAEIETDKVTIEIEAFDSGTLGEIVVNAGQVALVNSVIARFAGADGAAASAPPQAAAQQPAQQTAALQAPAAVATTPAAEEPGPPTDATAVVAEAPPATPGTTVAPAAQLAATPPDGAAQSPAVADDDVKASPLARRIAREAGVALGSITGSGPGGRVVREDVETFVAANGSKPAAQQAAAPAPVAAANPAPAAPPAAAGAPAPSPSASAATQALPTGSTLVPLTGMRRTIARKITQNYQAIPHIYITLDIDMGATMALRKEINAGLEKDQAISLNDFVLKASANALMTYPMVNVSFTEEGIQQHSAANISIAVALENGLIAPVLHNAHERSLGAIARESKRLVALAREGKLSGDLLQGGTFQVSNLGMFGVDQFGSIISAPQAAALAVGGIQRTPMFDGDSDTVVAKNLMKITVSVDHRALDGADAARFAVEVKRLLEQPMALLVG